MNALELLIRKTLLLETLAALLVGFAAANGTHIADLAREHHLQSRLIEFGIMRQYSDRGRWVELHFLQHFIGPLNDQFIGMRETLRSSEGRAGVYYHDAIIKRLGISGQRDSDMSGPYDDQSWGRWKALNEDIKRECACAALDGIGMCSGLSIPDGSLSISNNAGIQLRVAQRAFRSFPWKDQEFRANVLSTSYYRCQGDAFFLVQLVF